MRDDGKGMDWTPREESLGGGERLVASGATLMRVEQDAMLAVSVQRRRQEPAVLQAALEELELAPDMADLCFYSIPYEDRREGKVVDVTDLSVYGARNLARRWGNCSMRALVTGEDESKVTLSGVFVDLETNVRFERPFSVSKTIRLRSGKTVALSGDRLMQAIQAAASKAERNAIKAGLPSWLWGSYFKKVRKIAADATQKRIGEVLQAFRGFGVSREQIETRFGKVLERFDSDDYANLRGLLTALRDKETTVEEAFRAPERETPEQAASVASVLAGGATAAEQTRGGGSSGEARVNAPTAQKTAAPAPAPEKTAQAVVDWLS